MGVHKVVERADGWAVTTEDGEVVVYGLADEAEARKNAEAYDKDEE